MVEIAFMNVRAGKFDFALCGFWQSESEKKIETSVIRKILLFTTLPPLPSLTCASTKTAINFD